MAEVKVKVDSGVVNTRKSKEYAQKSEAWAVGKVDGVDVPNTADQYHNNSKYYKEQADASATAAASSESDAEQDALKSEGYAVGKQNGTDVSSGTYYHNNSKYFAIEAYNHSADADNAKIDAVNAKNAAASSKLDSEAYAMGKRNGSDVTSGDPAYHNNSKYYSGEASSSATSASSSASTATSKAQDSEAYAVGKRGGTDVTSGDPAYHNNSKYYSTQAASSATAASGSATSAASSATAAAASASAIAATYDSTKTYAVGEYCLYSGAMYRCTTAITTAEAWTAGHWTQVKVGTELTDLKEDFKDELKVITDGTRNVFDSEWSESGYGLDLDTGAEKTQTNWRRTGFVHVDPSSTYIASCVLTDVPGVYIFYYDEDKVFLNNYQTSYGAYPKQFTTPSDAAFVRVLHTSGAMPTYYQIEKGSIATPYIAPIIPKLEYTNTMESVPSKNLGGEWVNGGINYDTGADSADNYVRTNYIEVEPGKTYAFSISEIRNAYSCYAFYYSEDKTFISRDTTPYGWFPKVITIPNNDSIKYIRLLMQKSPSVVDVSKGQAEENSMSTTYRPSTHRCIDYDLLPNSAVNYRGKNVVAFGDSITAIGDVLATASGGWTSYFKASVKPSLWRNYAVGGSSWCDYLSGDFMSEQIDSFLSDNITNVDCFIIFSGTNDTNITAPTDTDIESVFYDSSMNLLPLDNIDRTTWQGAMRYAIGKLQYNYPNAKILVCTPIQRTYNSSEPVRSLYSTIKIKNEIIKKMCARLGVECVDTLECGISTGTGVENVYLADKLHPTPFGARVVAKYITAKYMATFNVE